MTVHYHGTPITPRTKMKLLGGMNFCVSFSAPHQVALAHELGQEVMLDNGAFSAWRRGFEVNWGDYYEWVEPWLRP